MPGKDEEAGRMGEVSTGSFHVRFGNPPSGFRFRKALSL